ncbi:MAG TPA: FliM/FliN family flagellar motor switch protein [Amnibacterium sp.]|uniref:FliM/FliN family flagellar motor switch protein n=1 Tax=Amnibacterium sp. TaxID=1872496 RepID=UPI002F929A36
MHPPGAADLDVRPYDFEKPELLSEPQGERLASAFESFGRSLGLQLTAKTRTVIDVEYGGYVISPAGALRDSAEPAAYVVAAVEGVRARAVLRLPLVEARFWASRLVGGTGAPSGEERLLTAVERALVWHLVDEHALELHLAFDGLLPTLIVEAFAYDRVRELAAPDDLMVQAGFALDRPGSRSIVTVTLPAEPILEALGHGAARQEQGLVTHRLEQHVAAAPVDVALRFADTRVPAAVVLSLAEGDLIPLDHPRHQPLAITMDGMPVVRAAVGGNGDRLACVVVDA